MITVEVPITLPSASNLREHYMARARRTKAQRLATGLVLRLMSVADRLKARGITKLGKGDRLAVRLTRVSPRRLDDDNLQAAFKGVRDEVAAYFHIDDRDPRIRFEYAQAAGKPSRVDIAFDIDSAMANAEAARARIDAEVARLTEAT